MIKTIFRILKDYIKTLIKDIIKDDFANAAGEMAYMTTLGIFPFMLFLVAVFSWLGKTFFINKIISGLSIIAPDEVITLIKMVLNEVELFQNGTLFAVIGFFITMFLASNAIAVIIKGLNRVNNVVENRTFIKVRILAMIMVFVNAFILFISINLIILGKVILNFISTYLPIPSYVTDTILITRWPIAFLLLFILASVNYYVLPARDFSSRRKSIIPGTLFFCIFWLFGSWGFSLYVNAFGTYNKVYGTIGIFAILMIWLYYSNLIFLIGGQVNGQTFKKVSLYENKRILGRNAK